MGNLTVSTDAKMEASGPFGLAQSELKVRTVPRIDSLSMNESYPTGGQAISIFGSSFLGENVQIFIGDEKCKLLEGSQQNLTCKTSASNQQGQALYLGQHGLRRKFSISESLLASIQGMKSQTLLVNPSLTLESFDPGQWLAQAITGFFRAPYTGSYRFHLEFVGQLKLLISLGNMTMSNKIVIFSANSSQQLTQWVNLTQGNYYFLEIHHQTNQTNYSSFNLGIEVKVPGLERGHPQTRRQVQSLKITKRKAWDQTDIVIVNPDDGTFEVQNEEGKVSVELTAKDTLQNIQSKLSSLFPSPSSLLLTSTSTPTTLTLSLHTTAFKPLLKILPLTTRSLLFLNAANPLSQQSELAGSYKLGCYLRDLNTVNITRDIAIGSDSKKVEQAIVEACHNYRGGVAVKTIMTNEEFEVRVQMPRGRYEVPTFEVRNSNSYPIKADGLTFSWSNEVPFDAETLYYDTIPSDFLFTDERMPQAKLIINGMQAACPTFTCGIQYVTPISIIDNFSVEGNQMTLTGTFLTYYWYQNLLQKELASTPCQQVLRENSNLIKCEFLRAMEAGIWYPVLADQFGQIPLGKGVKPHKVEMVVSSVAVPEVGVNPYGGDILIIKGTGFPMEKDRVWVSLDSWATCSLLTVTSEILNCRVLPTEIPTNATIVEIKNHSRVNVSIMSGDENQTTFTNLDQQVKMMNTSIIEQLQRVDKLLDLREISNKMTAKAPIIPRFLEISFKKIDQRAQYDIDEFIIRFIHVQNRQVIHGQIQQLIQNSTLVQIKLIFEGHEQGEHRLSMISKTKGGFNTKGFSAMTESFIKDFFPKSGSLFGGSAVTIIGENFPWDYGNQVDESLKITIGNRRCLLKLIYVGKIACTIEQIPSDVDPYEYHTLPSHVDILSVSIESSNSSSLNGEITQYNYTCQESGGCRFKWVRESVVSQVDVRYDEDLEDQVLILRGHGLLKYLDVDGYQTQTSVAIENEIIFQSYILGDASDNQLRFQLIYLNGNILRNLLIQLPWGTPDLTACRDRLRQGIFVEPRFIKVYPNIGSFKKTKISLIVKGLGYHSQKVNVVTSTGFELCQTIDINQWGYLYCITKEDLNITEPTALFVLFNGKNLSCTSNVTEQCLYQTSYYDLAKVTQISVISENTIRLTGTNLYKGKLMVARASFLDIQASQVQYLSQTSILVQFANYVPLTLKPGKIELFHSYQSDQNLKHDIWGLVQVTLRNAPATNLTLVQSVRCSFFGGCTFTIVQAGLYQNLKFSQQDPQSNKRYRTWLSICGMRASPILKQDNPVNIDFAIPQQWTKKIRPYQRKPDLLKGHTFSASDPQQSTVLWDSLVHSAWNSTTTGCFSGTSFKTGRVGLLSSIRFFQGKKGWRREEFAGRLRFEGSANGVKWTTLHTVGYEIHEGWNQVEFPQDQTPEYQHYRVSSTGSCDGLAEVQLYGLEVLDSNESTLVCKPILTLNEDEILEVQGNVTYSEDITPVVKSINPAYGPVEGGQIVTFTGERLTTNTSQVQIMIDLQECKVIKANMTHVQCITGNVWASVIQTALVFSQIETAGQFNIKFYIQDKGVVDTGDLRYYYYYKWSNLKTWGTLFLPQEGQVVKIEQKKNVLFDVNSTPVLKRLIIEGSLIVLPDTDPQHLRTLETRSLVVKQGGYLQIGTQTAPYTSRLVITLHSGDSTDPEDITDYSNLCGDKVFCVYNGALEIHGRPKTPSWSSLKLTVAQNTPVIQLKDRTNWEVGDKIVIASTNYNRQQTEEGQIENVDQETSFLYTLNRGLTSHHYGFVQKLEFQDTLAVSAEVAVLTRNVIIRGDPETSQLTEKGASILIIYDENYDETTMFTKLSHVAFIDLGQSRLLSDPSNPPSQYYGLEFRGNDYSNFQGSYLRGIVIERSYNRGIVINRARGLEVSDSVVYRSKGHAISVIGITSRGNVLTRNLALQTENSRNAQETDQEAAGFYFENPDNAITFNRALTSESHGFWTNLLNQQPLQRCPSGLPLRQFNDNLAHSNGLDGFRFTGLLSPQLEDPCGTGSPRETVLANLQSYRNMKHGIYAEEIGLLRFANLTLADNLYANMEVVRVQHSLKRGQIVLLEDSVMVGPIILNEFNVMLLPSNLIGLLAPYSNFNFKASNVRFHRFHELTPISFTNEILATTDYQPLTLIISNISFEAGQMTLPRTEIREGVIRDEDGSAARKDGWIVPKTMLQPTSPTECSLEQENYLLCNSNLQIKQIRFDETWIPLITGRSYRKNATMVKVLPSLAEKDIYITYQYSQVSRVEVKVGWENGTWTEGLQKGTQLKVIGDYNVTYRNSKVAELTYIIPGNVTCMILLTFLSIPSPTTEKAQPAPLATREGPRITQYLSWSSLALNKEDVTIPSGVETAFENTYASVYRVIRIYGSLKIVQASAQLRAQYLLVMPGGSLQVQGESIQITLIKSDTQVQDLPHGGGMLINYGGTVVMAGRDMGETRTRLKKRVQPGDPIAFVNTGLSWQQDFLLAFSSTTMNYWETDLAQVNFYGETTGLLELKKPFQYYYWGTSNLTSFTSTGVDMRGEVILLTRSIKLSLCQLYLTGNSSTNLTHVEISGTSCHSFQPIIKISGLLGEASMVGSSLRMEDLTREGSGIEISNSSSAAEIRICQNNMYGPFTGLGILVKDSANITIAENWLYHVRPYDSKYSVGFAVLQGSPMRILGNVIGCIAGPAEVVAGYQIIGSDCDEQSRFSGNVAHSIGGHGLIIKSLSHQICISASEFTAYKCQGDGVWVREPVFEVRLSQLTLIDNGFGVAPQVGLLGSTAKKVLIIQQAKFFGETEAIECFLRPQVCLQNPAAPQCHDRSAIMVADTNEVQVEIIYEDVQFIGYSKNTTKCSNQQAIFTQGPEASFSGFYPEVKIFNATFINSNQQAWTRFSPNSTILLSFAGSSDTPFQLTSHLSPAISISSLCQPLLPSTSTPLLCQTSNYRLAFLSLSTATSPPLQSLITLPPSPTQTLSDPLAFTLRSLTTPHTYEIFDPYAWDSTCYNWNVLEGSQEEGCQVWAGSRVHIRVKLGGEEEGEGKSSTLINMTQLIGRSAKVAVKEGYRLRVRQRVGMIADEVEVSVGMERVENGEVYSPEELQRTLDLVYETLDRLFQTPHLSLEEFGSKLLLGAVIYQTCSLDRTYDTFNETAKRTRRAYGVWADKGTLGVLNGQGNQSKQEGEQDLSSDVSTPGKQSSSLTATYERAGEDYHALTVLISVLISVISLIVISTIAYFALNYLKKRRKQRYKTEQGQVRTKGILKTPSCSPESKQLDFEIQGAKADGSQQGDAPSTQKEDFELSAFSSAPPPSVASSRELLSQTQQPEAIQPTKKSQENVQNKEKETFEVQQLRKRKKKKKVKILI